MCDSGPGEAVPAVQRLRAPRCWVELRPHRTRSRLRYRYCWRFRECPPTLDCLLTYSAWRVQKHTDWVFAVRTGCPSIRVRIPRIRLDGAHPHFL